MSVTFRKAVKHEARLRMALIGPSGSGKTYTALKVGTHLGERVAVVDTERGSASKYADLFQFDVLELTNFSPASYVEAIQAAETAGYDVLIIDSLSHAWMGKGGALELVDNAAKRDRNHNSFAAWREVTPLHNALVDAMLASNLHLVVTMRTKTEYVIEENERGKKTPRKVGMAPVQRDGIEYEFDVTADLDLDNTLIVSKTRCSTLAGATISKAGKELADTLKTWLSGEPAPPQKNGNSAHEYTPEQTRCIELWSSLRKAGHPSFTSSQKMLAHLIDTAHARKWEVGTITGLSSLPDDLLETYTGILADLLAQHTGS